MFTINLLPSQEKKLVRLEEARRALRFFAMGLAFIFIVGSALLSPSFLPLFLERRELERSLHLEEEAGRALGVEGTMARTKTLRIAVSSIKAFIRAPSNASAALEGLWSQSRDGITLINVTMKRGGEVVLTGIAQNRKDLLRFEKNLRDSGKFQDISSPLSNIIKENNISFTFQGKLKSSSGL